MTIKELLFLEIESAPEALLTETLNFLRFLKTKQVRPQSISEVASSAPLTPVTAPQPPVHSTGHSFSEHLKNLGTWEGDDLESCLKLVYATRA